MNKCSRCDEKAVIMQGHQWLCPKHYRFGQMRNTAKRWGKSVPSHQHLESIAPKDMKCLDCGISMNWRTADGKCTVATLQHYRDGSYGIVCKTCNTRHAFMEADSYRGMAKDHKFCPNCKEIKNLSHFYADRGRSGEMKIKSWCISCGTEASNKWKSGNREKYNAYQREWRARKKLHTPMQ